MDLALVVTQLKKFCPALSGRVGGAAAHERAAEQGYLAVPAAYVIPLSDDAEPNDDLTQLTQIVTEAVGIVLVIDNTPDRRGQDAALSIEALKYNVHKALLNWRIDPVRAARGLEYNGGSLVSVDGARLIWQLSYSHAITITEDDGFIPENTPLLHIDGHDPRLDPSWQFDTDLPQPEATLDFSDPDNSGLIGLV